MQRAVDPNTAMRSRGELIAFLAMAGALAVVPTFAYPVFLMKALCFALFACAFNLLIGYVGLLSFGHALFFGWAAYVSAHLATVGSVSLPYWLGQWHWLTIRLPWYLWSPEIAILGGVLFAAVLGLVVGTLAIRRQGIYFAMITLALAQMMFFFAVQAPFTHGEDGIQAVPRGRLFGLVDLADQTSMYVTVLVIFLGCFLLIYRIINSPFGEVLKAIRENEARAISLGYKTDRYKLLAFVLSATFAGVAGATKALVFQLASLTDVDWPMSGEVILMTLVGGVGTLFGPVAGAFFMVSLENYLTTIGQWLFVVLRILFGPVLRILFGPLASASFMVSLENYLTTIGQWVFVIQGFIFVVCVLLFRRGMIGELAQRLRIKL